MLEDIHDVLYWLAFEDIQWREPKYSAGKPIAAVGLIDLTNFNVSFSSRPEHT